LTVKVVVVAPAGTVTVDGTVAAEELDESVTGKPPVGAGPLMVTVPVDVAGARTVVGFSVRPVKDGGVTVRVAVGETPLAVAVIVTGVVDATIAEVTVNVAVVAPAGTVAVAGTVAAEVLLDESATVRPPVGAGLLIVTVPVEVLPPATVVGLSVRPEAVGAVTVRLAVSVTAPALAVITGAVFAATATVVTVAVALLAPAATVTEVGRVADGSLDVNVTVKPAGGA